MSAHKTAYETICDALIDAAETVLDVAEVVAALAELGGDK